MTDRQATRALNTGSRAWRLLRMEILRRDLFQCQQCGRFGDNVDHKDGNSHNNALENLQTLCRRCHSSKTAREDRGFGNASKHRLAFDCHGNPIGSDGWEARTKS